MPSFHRSGGRMQTELFNTCKLSTVEQLRIANANYIAYFNNTRRRPSALHMLTLTRSETLNTATLGRA